MKTNEGSSYNAYGDPFTFMANIYPAGGKIQAEMYGNRCAYILNMISEPLDISENDGVCVYVKDTQDPDYKVISIKRYSNHMCCELEKLQ